jgi:hypothetical protein
LFAEVGMLEKFKNLSCECLEELIIFEDLWSAQGSDIFRNSSQTLAQNISFDADV